MSDDHGQPASAFPFRKLEEIAEIVPEGSAGAGPAEGAHTSLDPAVSGADSTEAQLYTIPGVDLAPTSARPAQILGEAGVVEELAPVLPLDNTGTEPGASPAPPAVTPPQPIGALRVDPPPTIPAPHTTATSLSTRRALPLDPIPGLMPARETHMLSGSSGAGKTSWVGWFVSQLLTAETIFDRPVQRPPFVAYISGDRSLRDAEEKFIRAGWLEPIMWGIVETRGLKTKTAIKNLADGAGNKEEFPILMEAIDELARMHKLPSRRLPDDSLLIIDSMSTILGIEPSGSYLRNVAAPLVMLNRFCREGKLTVLLVHHGGKQVADKTQRYARAQDKILGSMALLGFTSTQFQLTEPELTTDPSLALHELTVVSHSCKGFALQFERSPETGVFRPLIGSLPPPGARENQATLEAEIPARGLKATILKSLKTIPEDSAVAVAELQERLGRKTNGRAMFFRALRALIEEGFLEEIIDAANVRWVRLKPGGSS